jgi:hypothetical protein
MAAINFPDTPTPGDLYSEANITWQWTGTTWDVVEMERGLIASTGSVVHFDYPRRYGYPTAITGNITFDFTNGVLGADAIMRHNDGTIPTLPATAKVIAGEYLVDVNNYICFILVDKTESAEEVWVTISQEIV